MMEPIAIDELAERLRQGKGLVAKRDIAAVSALLGLPDEQAVAVGDDCAAIPNGDGYTLFAIEGFMNEFVAGDPWFAGAAQWSTSPISDADGDLMHPRRGAGQRSRFRLALAEVAPIGMTVAVTGASRPRP